MEAQGTKRNMEILFLLKFTGHQRRRPPYKTLIWKLPFRILPSKFVRLMWHCCRLLNVDPLWYRNFVAPAASRSSDLHCLEESFLPSSEMLSSGSEISIHITSLIVINPSQWASYRTLKYAIRLRHWMNSENCCYYGAIQLSKQWLSQQIRPPMIETITQSRDPGSLLTRLKFTDGLELWFEGVYILKRSRDYIAIPTKTMVLHTCVAQAMSKTRWEQIYRYLHVCDVEVELQKKANNSTNARLNPALPPSNKCPEVLGARNPCCGW